MTRLDTYIFRQGAVPFLLILACTTAVIWLTQVLQRLDLMVEDGGSLGAFLQVTVLLIPSLVGVIAPFALIGAVLYALNVFTTDNEMPVMAAAGASRLRIARPLILLSVLVSGLVLIINIDLQPRSYRVLKETVEAVRSDVAKAFIRSGIFAEVMPGVTVFAEKVQPGDQYVGLLIHDAREPENAVTYTAERGLFQITRAGPRLLLARGTIQRVDPQTGKTEILRFIETAVDIAEISSDRPERNLESTERYVSELLSPDLSSAYDRDRAARFIAEGHARLSTPLYPMAFAMMALAVMLQAPVARRGQSALLLYVLGAAILLRTVGYILQSAAAAAPVANLLQYLLPMAVIGGSFVWLAGYFWRVRRRPAPDLRHILSDPEKARPA